MSITYRNRQTGELEKEQIYGESALKFLYNNSLFSRFLLQIVCKNSLISRLYGWWQKQPFTKSKIIPFIQKYQINASEFEKKPEQFTSFNDFFIRTLKKEARPISTKKFIIPADGRYLAFPNISTTDGFLVKGAKFNLNTLLQNDELASRYAQGTMVMGRLCPTDYHRFHFPCDNTPSQSTLINGYLYSVNPIALKRNCNIFTENKRVYTLLNTQNSGKILFMEIGATNVGTIMQTYTPHRLHKKGDEKGYFSFGGSSLILLFEPNTITLDQDLATTGTDKIELRCLMGQPLGG